jgi:hypothetical protein
MDSITNTMTAPLPSFGMPATGAASTSACYGVGPVVRTRRVSGVATVTVDAMHTNVRIAPAHLAAAPTLVAPTKFSIWDSPAWRPPVC